MLAVALLAAPDAMAKTFRVNVVADPAQMDPITQSELVAGRILRNMYEGFTVTTDGTGGGYVLDTSSSRVT